MEVANMIIQGVAEKTGEETTDLPPLQRTIDVDALEDIIESTDKATEIQLRYYGCEVTVDGEGNTTVRPTEDSEATLK